MVIIFYIHFIQFYTFYIYCLIELFQPPIITASKENKLCSSQDRYDEEVEK